MADSCLQGTLAFVGDHHDKGTPRCGVHMETAVGKNNGTVGGFTYFECPDNHGVLVPPHKVTVVVPWHRRLSSEQVSVSAARDTDTRATLPGNALSERAPGAGEVDATDLGRKVKVAGYAEIGILQWFGVHVAKGKTTGKLRCGIEFPKAVGKNNGTLNGVEYFKCPDNHVRTVEPPPSPQRTSARACASMLNSHTTHHQAPHPHALLSSLSSQGALVAPAKVTVHDAEPKKKNCKSKAAPKGVPNAVLAADVGSKVTVEGYEGQGTLKFFGNHAEKETLRCGVVFDAPIGKNDGTVGGHRYFECPAGCGILVVPERVSHVGRARSERSGTPAVGKATKQAKATKQRPSSKPPAGPVLTVADIGSTVTVEGYEGQGTLKFVGDHAEKKIPRCGVAFGTPIGKNDGTVGGHKYFECSDGCGVLVAPDKVARSLDELVATMTKGLDGFGLTVNSAGGVSGTYVTNLREGSVSEASFTKAGLDIEDGLRIQSINGVQLIEASKKKCVVELVKTDTITIVLVKSPANYAKLGAAVTEAKRRRSTAEAESLENTAAEAIAAEPDGTFAAAAGDGTTFDEPPALSPTVEADENDENDEAAAPVTQSWTFPPVDDGEVVPAVSSDTADTVSEVLVAVLARGDEEIAPVQPAAEAKLDALDDALNDEGANSDTVQKVA